MTDSIEEEESSSGNHELEPKARPPSGGPWDPLSSFRKTISPTQRMELLQMKVPVLPPEDFMDTADFQRARAARWRRFLPLVLAVGALLFVLLFVGLWSRFWSTTTTPQRDSSTRATPAHIEQPSVASASSAIQATADPLHIAAAVPPTVTALVAPAESPPTTKPVAQAPIEAAPSSSSEPNPRSAPRSVPALPQPKTATPLVPDPVPSNTLWTKPR
ncbi:MAG TPA: hypothetical protein VIK01_26385 [Polyangiaceae bacterium]